MSVRIDLDELLSAYEWVSAGEAAGVDAEAYVSRRDGQIHWCGEGVDEECPEDVDDGAVYIAVPHQSELDLGRSLALRFAGEHLPRSREEVDGYFRKRGAYSRFKALLERAGQLTAWYQYEEAAKEKALSDGEAYIGEAQEDQAEDGAGVFLSLQTRVGAELVRGIPEALFECGRGSVFGRGCNPAQQGSP